MMTRAPFLSTLLLFGSITLSGRCAAQVGADAASLYRQISRAVVRLEYVEVLAHPGQDQPAIVLKPAGSAFFVRYKDMGFLVTARHVAEKGFDMRARVPMKRNDIDSADVFVLDVPWRAWHFHPRKPSIDESPVDVAVTRIHKWPGGHSLTVVSESLIDTNDPSPPLDVLVFGYPGDIGFELSTQYPMARFGVVALTATKRFVKVEGKFFDERGFLLDARIFGGNSGSPVFSKPGLNSTFKLVGLVSASNQGQDYAVCEPVTRIVETLESAIDLVEDESNLPSFKSAD